MSESNEVAILPQSNVRQIEDMPIAEHQQQVHIACPALSKAISMARKKCKSASKDKTNEFHKYKYASADEVILTAKEALSGSGLAIIPQLQEMTVVGSGNLAFYALNRVIFLSHESGEFVPLSVRGWPVVVERGKTLDKAFATALTGSMAYLLRDLLQMPRGDDHDMNSRDDRPAQQSKAPDVSVEELVRQHAKKIEHAETIVQLRTAFEAAMSDSRVSAYKQRLAKLKDERKTALSPIKPAPAGEPGDPDSDPFASGELFASERERLEATK